MQAKTYSGGYGQAGLAGRRGWQRYMKAFRNAEENQEMLTEGVTVAKLEGRERNYSEERKSAPRGALLGTITEQKASTPQQPDPAIAQAEEVKVAAERKASIAQAAD